MKFFKRLKGPKDNAIDVVALTKRDEPPPPAEVTILPPRSPNPEDIIPQPPIRGRYVEPPLRIPEKPKEAFAAGTLVRLPSGSPIMTSGGRHPQDHNSIQCFWFDPKENTHRVLNFPKDMLVEVSRRVQDSMVLMAETQIDGDQYQEFLALADRWSRIQQI